METETAIRSIQEALDSAIRTSSDEPHLALISHLVRACSEFEGFVRYKKGTLCDAPIERQPMHFISHNNSLEQTTT